MATLPVLLATFTCPELSPVVMLHGVGEGETAGTIIIIQRENNKNHEDRDDQYRRICDTVDRC